VVWKNSVINPLTEGSASDQYLMKPGHLDEIC